MVETRLNLEEEVQEILRWIDRGENFLLSGGAGSGKTHSLVQLMRQILQEQPNNRIACMTYTNAAVKEIEDRVKHKNVNVTTIHDFLWDNIKHFQKELKGSLVTLINSEKDAKIVTKEGGVYPVNYFDNIIEGIQYREYVDIKKGIVSHDELLILASHLFEHFPKLCDIVKDKYPYIFIDEYQDTDKSVVDIFLIYFKKSAKKNIIGFFGDAMQSIYDDTIGNLDSYKGESAGFVKEVRKLQNRRNPYKVITLANRLRTDGLIQGPSKDLSAPNMVNGVVKPGNIVFCILVGLILITLRTICALISGGISLRQRRQRN